MAPLPEPSQEDFPGAASVDKIAAAYKETQDRIAATLLSLIAQGRQPTAAERKRVGRMVKGMLATVEAGAVSELRTGVQAAIAGGGDAVARALEQVGPIRRPPNTYARRVARANLADTLAKIEDKAVKTGAEYFASQTLSIGRQVDDHLRRMGLRAVAQGIEESAGTRQVSADLIQRITSGTAGQLIQDVSGNRFVKDSAGRLWSPENYSRLVARTTTREAQTQGFIAKARADGMDLVQVSQHDGGAIDPICVPYEGQVFSLSGQGGYPVLDQSPPFHPNCRHVLTPAPMEAYN